MEVAQSDYALWVEQDGKRICLYKPEPHQLRFHSSTTQYTLMEGGRGSGKSLAMRMDAYMRCLSIPRFRALLLRRTFPELKKSHLQDVPVEAKKLGLPNNAWHTTDHALRFPNGSMLVFGHVEDDTALTKYLSSEWEATYWDELTTFSEKHWAFINSSLRSPIKGFKPFSKAGTNPIGPGFGWVKAYFITKNVPYDQNPEYVPDDYLSIHCTLKDNPHVDQAHYTKILSAIPSESVRKALLHGEWLTEGQFFSEWQETKDGKPWHVIDTLPTYHGRPITEAPHIQIVRVVDWGYSKSGNPGVCLWFAVLTDGTAICFQEYVFYELTPAEAADAIKQRSEGLKIRYTIGDTAMWQEHEGPSIAERFENRGIGMIEADKHRIPGWAAVHTWLKETINDGTGERPRLRFLRSGCPHTIRTLPEMVVDPKDPLDMLTTGVEDDPADCVRYFCQDRGGPSRESQVKPEVSEMWRDIRRAQRRNDYWAPAGVLRGA